MPLATKNGSVIVKDGLLAENCGCCQTGCCGNGESLADLSASVSITWTHNTNPSAEREESRRCWPVSIGTRTTFATWDVLVPTNDTGDTGPCTKLFLDLGSGLANSGTLGPVGQFLYTNIAIAPVAGSCQLSFFTTWSSPGCSANNLPLRIPFMTWGYVGPGTYTLTYYVWSLFERTTFDATYTEFTLRLKDSKNSLSATIPPSDYTIPSHWFWSMTATANVVVQLV